jgi:hypothetical protein
MVSATRSQIPRGLCGKLGLFRQSSGSPRPGLNNPVLSVFAGPSNDVTPEIQHPRTSTVHLYIRGADILGS